MIHSPWLERDLYVEDAIRDHNRTTLLDGVTETLCGISLITGRAIPIRLSGLSGGGHNLYRLLFHPRRISHKQR